VLLVIADAAMHIRSIRPKEGNNKQQLKILHQKQQDPSIV